MKDISRVFAPVFISLSCLGLTAAHAEPAMPDMIRIVVPFSPGASNDVFGRAMSLRLSKALGVNVIVENKPGAGGVIGASEVARSKPDGSTLLFSSTSFVTSVATQKKPAYDATTAFTPIAVVASGAMLFVAGKSTPYTSVADVLNDPKAKQGLLNYGSAGIGSIGHMSSELLNLETGTEMVHVPYKGISNAVTDMIGGRLELMITTPASVSAALQNKDIRVLGTTSSTRSKFYPDVPAIAEVVPDYSVDVWWGVFAPAGTPKAYIDKMNKAIREVSAEPEMLALFAKEGTAPSNMNSDEAAQYVAGELDKWKRLATERNIVASH